MPDTVLKTQAPAPGRKASWGKRIAIVLSAILLLLLIGYLVVTSSAFFKGVILPKAGKAMNATITVSDASISPFSQVVLKDLKVQTTGTDPLLTASEIRLRYGLMAILRGNMKVDEVTVVNPVITLVQNPDGTSNLDPLLKSSKSEPETKEGPKSSAPLKIDVRTLQVKDGTVRQIKVYSPANRDQVEISKLNVALTNLRNGQTGKITVSGDLKIQDNRPAKGGTGQLLGRFDGEISLGLAEDLKPSTVKGDLKAEVTQAEGAFAQASGFASDLSCNLTATEIQELALKFSRGNSQVGQIRAQGPFSMDKLEGKISIQLLGVDKQLLNLASAGTGMDFGGTTLSSSNVVTISQGGKLINTEGQFNLNKFSVTRTNQTTPPLDLSLEYASTADLTKGSAVIQKFALAAVQQGNMFLKGGLTAPMTLAWGTAGNEVGDSVMNVSLTRFDLSEWKAFLGQAVPKGTVNGQLRVISKGAGKSLSFELGSQVEDLSVVAGSNTVSQISLSFSASGTATNLEQFSFPEYKFQLGHRAQRVLSVSGSGGYDLKTQAATLDARMDAALARLLELMPIPGVAVTSGDFALKAKVSQQKQSQNVSADVAITNLVGHFGSNDFRSFGALATLEFAASPQKVQVNKLTGTISEAGKPGGKFDASASYDRSTSAAQLSAALTNFNQDGLRPFLEPLFTGKKLVSVLVNGNLTAQYNPAGDSDIKGSLVATNLTVADNASGKTFPQVYARAAMDVGLNKQVAELRTIELGLTPTEKAGNVIKLTGRVDATRSNAITGTLKLTSDSLDLSRYYDLFESAGTKKESGAPSVGGQGSGSGAGTQGEAPPISVPLTNFTADAMVGRFFLREIAITNLHAAVRIDGGRIVAKPMELVLNGAKVGGSADVDVSVPGYRYALDFSAVEVPLAPLVNSFTPERRGQVGGTLTGVGQLAGAGTTGSCLQTLNGKYDIGTTNLNLALESLRSPLLKSVVNVIAVLPEIIKNPNAALGSLAGALTSGSDSGQKGGFMDELTQSPIDVIKSKGSIGGGKLELSDTLIQSPAFQAGAKGTVQFRNAIHLDEAITNATLSVPLTVALRRSLAEKIDFVPAGTPTNQTYVRLPDYVAIEGTVGDPKRRINSRALLGTALQHLGGKIPGVDQKTGNLIQGIGEMLSGRGQTTTNVPAGTNQATKGNNLLEGLGGLLGGGRATNAPGTTNAPATNKPAAGSLLDQLLGPGKKK